MTTVQIENDILLYLKGLPKETLLEVIDFIQFLTMKKNKENKNNLAVELGIEENQTAHLEEEFKDYKELYPREN